MGPGMRIDLALHLLLDPVVTDRSRSIECLVDLLPGQRLEEPGVNCVPSPDAGEAVGLQLGAHRATLGAGVSPGLEQAEQVLDVMPVLVRDHVHLGERTALGAELGLKLLVEAEVEVDGLIERTVERPHRAGRSAARGIDRIGEEERARGLVLVARGLERAAPILVEAVHGSDDPAVLALVRIGPGLAFGGELAGDRPRVRLSDAEATEVPEVAARQEDQRDDDEGAEAAADRDSTPTHASATTVGDLAGI